MINEDSDSFQKTVGGEKYTVFKSPVLYEWTAVTVFNNSQMLAPLYRKVIVVAVVLAAVFALIIILVLKALKIINSHTKKEQESIEKLNEMTGNLIRGNLKVVRLSSQIINALSTVVDAKDKYTNGHSTRVGQYAREIAIRMKKSSDEVQNIYYAGLLHDVGKVAISEEIINKPGRLTDEEYETIKSHTSEGARILEAISELPLLSIGAHWHHERYDGKGYPDGLAGEEIPEIARIICVADCYDAMSSNRSYRDTMSQEYIRGELEKGKGTQFDPDIADIMISMIDVDVNYHMREKTSFMDKLKKMQEEKEKKASQE